MKDTKKEEGTKIDAIGIMKSIFSMIPSDMESTFPITIEIKPIFNISINLGK